MTNQISSSPFPVYFKGGSRKTAQEAMENALHRARCKLTPSPDAYYRSQRSPSQDRRLVAAAKQIGSSSSTTLAVPSSPYVPTQILPYSQRTVVPREAAATMRAVSKERRSGNIQPAEYANHRAAYEASTTTVRAIPAPGAIFQRGEFYPPPEATALIEQLKAAYIRFSEKGNAQNRASYKSASAALKEALSAVGFPSAATHYGSISDGKAIPFYRSRSSSPNNSKK